MTNNDLIKSIRGVVKEEIESALKPVKKTLGEHTNILEKHTKKLGGLTSTLDGHTKKLEGISSTLDTHTRKLDGLTDQLADVSVEVTEIKEAIKSHDKRISTIEDKLDLPSPIK